MNTTSSPIGGFSSSGGITRGNGGFSIVDLPIAFIIGAIGSVAVGAALFFSSKVIYLILVSPLVAAAVAGGVTWIAVYVGSVRNKILGLLIGILIGAGAYGVYRVGEYLDVIIENSNFYREDIREALTRNNMPVTDEGVEEILNEYLMEETGTTGIWGLMRDLDFYLQEIAGDTGFIGFLKYQAQEGFTISSTRPGSSSGGAPIKDGLAWGYWGIELLFMAVVAGLVGLHRAKQPFCTEQRRWLSYENLGQVSHENITPFLDYFEQNALQEAASLMVSKTNSNPKLVVQAGRCNPTSQSGFVKITVITTNKNNTDQKVIFDNEVQRLDLLISHESKVKGYV